MAERGLRPALFSVRATYPLLTRGPGRAGRRPAGTAAPSRRTVSYLRRLRGRGSARRATPGRRGRRDERRLAPGCFQASLRVGVRPGPETEPSRTGAAERVAPPLDLVRPGAARPAFPRSSVLPPLFGLVPRARLPGPLGSTGSAVTGSGRHCGSAARVRGPRASARRSSLFRAAGPRTPPVSPAPRPSTP